MPLFGFYVSIEYEYAGRKRKVITELGDRGEVTVCIPRNAKVINITPAGRVKVAYLDMLYYTDDPTLEYKI